MEPLMVEETVSRPLRRAPTHPGELMHEIIVEQLRLSIAEAARRMEVSRQSLHAVLAGDSAVTADMALRFGALAGAAPELYLHMQDVRDLWQARQRLGPALARVGAVATRPVAGPRDPARFRRRTANDRRT